MATTEDRQMVFNEIVPKHTIQLIQDMSGNYVGWNLLHARQIN